MDAIFKRISVRKYQDRPVEEEKIQQILRAAMAAPSAKNQQPWEFFCYGFKRCDSEIVGMQPLRRFSEGRSAGHRALLPVCWASRAFLCGYRHEHRDGTYPSGGMQPGTGNLLDGDCPGEGADGSGKRGPGKSQKPSGICHCRLRIPGRGTASAGPV